MRGKWIRLRDEPYLGCIALVLTESSCLVERLPEPGRNPLETDVCDIADFPSPLHHMEFPAILPTYDEVTPFKNSRHLLLRSVTFFGRCPALAAGDRAVVVRGPYRHSSGFISILTDVPFSDQIASFAKIVDSIPDVVCRGDPGVIVPIGDLVRHAVEIPYAFRVLDRVRVVVGIEYRGCTGRVSKVRRNVVTVQLASGTIFKTEPGYLTREFHNSDLVEVFRGEFKTRRGFVIFKRAGGIHGIIDVKDGEYQPDCIVRFAFFVALRALLRSHTVSSASSGPQLCRAGRSKLCPCAIFIPRPRRLYRRACSY